ncbi:unnamed protein product [Candidula unifasciata]|uniref:Major facilitator superfamily (MFS) profile domain-containing protein n=1 Tax=Candidula unifasciata TaxID=100452 RepID=A0A8S3YTP5_9EUPU|nr:unnamed protein product [Candidula unifasciata]
MPSADETRDLLASVYSISGTGEITTDEYYRPVHAVYSPAVQAAADETSNIKVYKRRWYILFIFGMYAFSQNLVWNTWGPITLSSEHAFGWSNTTIAWLTNWGPVSYILTGLFFPWLLQVKGLRWAILSSMFLVAVGAGLRVITSEPLIATILIHFGQFLNGVAGPVAMSAFPTLSATWFPPQERVTATAIGTSISIMGAALAFILGPIFVSTLPPSSNGTSHLNSTYQEDYSQVQTTIQPNNTADIIAQERKEIMMYMYYQCGFTVFVFAIILCYFPAKPPNPPCVSATVERDLYWAGLWSLRKKGYFLIIAVTYGVSLGVINVWASVIAMNLAGYVSQKTAGWIGFYATLGACAASLVIGRFADLFVRYIKLYILIMYILGTGFLVAFALLLIGVIPYAEVYVYVTVIAANVLFNAAVPMLYEMGCELAYPTSEGAANGILTYVNNFCGLVFLAVFSFQNVGTMWMNWAAIGSTAVCIPLIVMLKGRFNRLEVDQKALRTLDQEIVVN